MFIDETRDIINEFVDNSVTEDYLESLLLPTREKILESNRKCNAYLHDSTATSFVNFTDASKRNYKIANDEANVAENTDDTVTTNSNNGKDGGDVCSTNTRSKYFLYHITNLYDVVNKSAVPIVEKRGPWVFKKESRNYVLKFDEVEKT